MGVVCPPSSSPGAVHVENAKATKRILGINAKVMAVAMSIMAVISSGTVWIASASEGLPIVFPIAITLVCAMTCLMLFRYAFQKR